MKRNRPVWLSVLVCSFAGISFPASVRQDSAKRVWILETGAVQYRLRQTDGGVRLEYFGPKGAAEWRMGPPRRGEPVPSMDISGSIEGQSAAPEDLELKSAEPGLFENPG